MYLKLLISLSSYFFFPLKSGKNLSRKLRLFSNLVCLHIIHKIYQKGKKILHFIFSTFFIILCLNNLPLFSFDSIVISENQSHERIGKKLYILEDPNIEFKNDDIVKGNKDTLFKPGNDSIPNFGFSNSQFWFKILLQNESSIDDDYLIEIEFVGLDEVELFFLDKENQIKRVLTGDSFNFNSRPISHKNFIFPIKINPKESQIYYLRIKTESTITLPINVWNHKDFYTRDYKLLFLFGSFFGIIMIMVVFFHLLYYSFQDKSFFYYSIYIFFSGIFLATYYGFIFQYFLPTLPRTNTFVLLYSALITLIFSVLFSRDFLQIDSLYPNLLNIFKFFLYLGISLSPIIPFLNFTYSAQLISLYAIVWQLISSGIAIFLGIRKNLYAQFHTFASISVIFFMTFSLLSNFNLYPRTTHTLYGFLFAYSFEIIIFSLGMGLKVYKIRMERAEIVKKSGEFREQLNSIQMEINTASRIHRTILPSGVPNIDGLDIYAVYIPSNTIGGDFYDFYQRDQKLGIFIADVTGHGISASLFASSVKYCFSKGVKYFIEPNRLLAYINSALYQKLGNQLLTAGYILIDTKSRTLAYASCGHPPLLIWKSKENRMLEIKPKGKMIGIQQDIQLEKITMPIESGDRILLYTDGLTECENPQGEAYGDGFLEEFFKKSNGVRTKSTSKLLLKNLSVFSGSKVRYQDDITYILIDVI